MIYISSDAFSLFAFAVGLAILSSHPRCAGQRDEFIYGRFPPGFQWGFATAAHQIEGGWESGGKGRNIWDTFSHANGGANIIDRSNAETTCDSYHRHELDVQALRNVGATFYRFSISWSRIIPTGRLEDGINWSGIIYYNSLINSLIQNGITPFVTLYHWDLPQPLENNWGWLNQETVWDYRDYARVVFQSFGDRVKHWMTFNEPKAFCGAGYGSGEHAPGRQEVPWTGVSFYLCGNHVIKAHGLVYRLYETEFKAIQDGRIGIALDTNWHEPSNPNWAPDVAAAWRQLQFDYGHFAYPLYHGEYPPIMRQMIDAKSWAEGRWESKLPSFDAYWTNIINGTLDFIGVNHYTSSLVYHEEGSGDADVSRSPDDPTWEGTAAPWLKIVPWGFRKLLNWISNEYKHPQIYVTENGCPSAPSDGVNDPVCVSYYRRYINEMLKAVNDGANVVGYASWTLMDNFEWAAGYTQRFGVHRIDFSDPNLTRVPKQSANFLRQVFADNGFPEPMTQ